MITDLEKPILITGCARSGTSMTAGVFNICGAFGGKMSGSTPYNRKGMFENTEIRNGITKPFLVSIGADPLCQNPLPDIEKVWESAYSQKEDKNNLRFQVLRVITGNGYTQGRWFYKGAKMCLLWPLWNYAFPFAQWVIVRRAKEDIIKSCLKTKFMRNHSTPEGWRGWAETHEKRFIEMFKFGLQIKEVWPQKMINGDFSEIQECVEWTKLKFNLEAVREFISPELWSQNKEVAHGK